MQQLLLSSPTLGSCIPNLGRCLAHNNLVKINNLEKYFMDQEITPLDIYHPNLTFISLFKVEIFFSQVHPFLALLFNLGHFGHLEPAST